MIVIERVHSECTGKREGQPTKIAEGGSTLYYPMTPCEKTPHVNQVENVSAVAALSIAGEAGASAK